ncbi:IS5 family transposase [Roseomonas indoligenes]|uniref:IS5 family transposase n=1 Tax=Roseomonas indoligenes TaxID=2820811 RepID=A0A940MWC9_9PROT|nr:IS5 family transposase [Pararoseomonas indoligenes]MBP0492893.1 IS5 family transposase [Pararoseomonas indoligenes]
MSTPPFLLSIAQMRRLAPHFPLSHGVPRVDDRRVISGIIFVIRRGLQWRDAPAGYGPHKTLYNRFVRWSRMGVFDRIFAALAAKAGTPKRIMIDSTHLKVHRTAASLLERGLFPRCLGRTKGGLNSKFHAACDDEGRPVVLLLTEGQMSDHRGAAIMFPRLPPAHDLIADRGYDSRRFRAALEARGTAPCIPSTRSRKIPIPHDAILYKQRHHIEIMFGRPKDWRRIATRYDRSAHTFFAAVVLASIVTFWLPP